MTFRSRRLLDAIHDCPCQAKFEHACVDFNGSEPAHADWSEFGRGMGHKAHDNFSAAMCRNAHQMISAQINPPFDRETRKQHWLTAYIGTQVWLWSNNRIRVA